MQEHRGRGKNQMYTCDKCGKTFTERNNLVVHQYKNHWTEGMEEPKVLVCQVSPVNYSEPLDRGHGGTQGLGLPGDDPHFWCFWYFVGSCKLFNILIEKWISKTMKIIPTLMD